MIRHYLALAFFVVMSGISLFAWLLATYACLAQFPMAIPAWIASGLCLALFLHGSENASRRIVREITRRNFRSI